MKRLVLISFILFVSVLQGQVDSLFNYTYNQKLSDVWGYVDEKGNEYALVGLYDGVSIVDVTDPENVQEVYRFVSTHETNWRDLKVHADYLYVTNESGGGLNIIDLSPLPQSNNLNNYSFTGSNYPFETAHNLYISDTVAYIVGSNYSAGGMIALDLSNPIAPVEMGVFDNYYIHDVFVANNLAYTSNVVEGSFSIVDITDPSNMTVVGSAKTKGNTTHNTWVTNNGNVLLSTDEINGGEIGVYDISDRNNIERVDGFKAFYQGDEMPHNVHVKDSLAYISYYKTGLVVLNIEDSSNVIEVGRFDTDKSVDGPNGGFGAWGVYPYLPSGTILVSDIKGGLFGFNDHFKSPAYLEISVTDSVTGFPLDLVDLKMLKSNWRAKTTFSGVEKMGTVDFGADTLIVSKFGYRSDTIILDFQEGQTIQKSVKLFPLEKTTLTLEVQGFNNLNIANASVIVSNNSGYYKSEIADANGELILNNFPVGEYTIYAGKWGYHNNCQDIQLTALGNEYEIKLIEGVNDDFSADQGWQYFNSKDATVWERTKPIASYDIPNGFQHDPGVDGSDADCGSFAYCTGISEFKTPATTTVNWKEYLISPNLILDSNTPFEVALRYYLGISPLSNDTIKMGFIQDTDTIITNFYTADDDLNIWKDAVVKVPEVLDFDKDIRFFVLAEDDVNPWDVVDFAIDNFSLDRVWSTDDLSDKCLFPYLNGVNSQCGSMEFWVYNAIGQLVHRERTVNLNLSTFQPGVYFVRGNRFRGLKIQVVK